MTTGHLNLRWSLEDMDEIQRMARSGGDSATIAEAFLSTAEEIEALCARNGITVRRAMRSRPSEDSSE